MKQSPISYSPGKFVGSPTKRREMDVMKLMMSDYEVDISEDNTTEFFVKFNGPRDTPYEGGVWRVRVTIPDAYPYKSPGIGFTNTIFHPNVDEASGTVCLDVINQTWSPLFDLKNVFDVFLPQLLTYPNPSDPLNGEAASLLLKEPERYKEKIKYYVEKYASNKNVFKKDEIKEDEEDTLSNASLDSNDLNEFDMDN